MGTPSPMSEDEIQLIKAQREASAQAHEERYQRDKAARRAFTSEGIPVTAGLRVFTSNCRWATVIDCGEPYDDEGWFTVAEDGTGSRTLLNASRVAVRDNITHTTDPEATLQALRRYRAEGAWHQAQTRWYLAEADWEHGRLSDAGFEAAKAAYAEAEEAWRQASVTP